MRRRRAKQLQPGVSLFPFLAVLICTLGVLIVILVLAVQSASVAQANHENEVAAEKAEAAAQVARDIATKKARQESKRIAREAEKQKQREIIEQLEDKIDLHAIQSEGFSEDRPRLRQEVAKARDFRAHLEKEIEKLEEQAEQLVAEIKLLDSDLGSVQSVDDSELETLRKQLADAETRLDEKRQSTITITEKKYAIVPYRGAGGTKRVPVFVECNRDGVVLQPWNIRLKHSDFFHPVTAGNPVDAALLAIRNYYLKYELTEKDQRPYPLLVIRPDGAQSYGLARRSLVSWDDEFGYELVTQDKELDFGTVDPQLENEVQQAVKKAKLAQLALKRRQATLARASGGGPGSGNRQGSGFGGGLRAASSGGFVREGTGSRTSQNRQVGYQNSQSQDERGENQRGENHGDPNQQGTNQQASSERIPSSFESGSVASAGPASNTENANSSSTGPSASGTNQPGENLAASRGANWALPTQTDGATGYVRPVSIVCEQNSVTLRNVAGQAVTIPMTDPKTGVDDMVNIIWQRIDAWGIAGANAYWKPNLSVSVRPGARPRFQMLKQMLRNSGLGIEEVSP